MNHTTVEELIQLSGETGNVSFVTSTPPLQLEPFAPIPTPPIMIDPPRSTGTFMDVHRFDYSYKDQPLEPSTLTLNEKRDWIDRLMERMTNQAAIHGTRLIIANIGQTGNMDHTNQKAAEDILVLLAKHVLEKDHEFLPMIEEQLQDMVQLGQCPQGRTTRLWQLYKALA